MTENEFEKAFSNDGFWNKVKKYAGAAGKRVLDNALTMYYSARDPDTPLWAKTTIYAALGYFIVPFDAIADITPITGYSDDLGVLVAAVATVAAHIKAEHREHAAEKLKEWFKDM